MMISYFILQQFSEESFAKSGWLVHDFMCPDYCSGSQQIVYPKHSSPKSDYVNRYPKNSLHTSKYHWPWKWTVHCMLLSTKEKCMSQISFTAFILHSNTQMCSFIYKIEFIIRMKTVHILCPIMCYNPQVTNYTDRQLNSGKFLRWLTMMRYFSLQAYSDSSISL